MIIPVIIPPEEKPPNMAGCAGSEKNEYGIWVCLDAQQLQTRIDQIKIEREKPIDWTPGIVFIFLILSVPIGGVIIVMLHGMYESICDYFIKRKKNR